MQVGQVVRSGTFGGHQHDVTYVGGVGEGGVGPGIFTWQVKVKDPQHQEVLIAWMAGSDPDLAVRAAEYWIRELTAIS